MAAQIKASRAKLEKMRKMESARNALAEYRNILSIARYDLADDEAVCAAIYAFAYIPDKTTMVSHLETARRNSRISVDSLSAGDLIKHKGALKSTSYLSRARGAIKENEPDYDADSDVSCAHKEGTRRLFVEKSLRKKTGGRVSYGPKNVRTTNGQNRKTNH